MAAADFVLIDDRLVPAAEACVPVGDRGFLYGDAVYETLRAYSGRPFQLPAHLERLARSAAAIYLRLPWSPAELTERLAHLLAANRIDAGRLRITITRGAGELRARPEALGPARLVMTAEPLQPLPDAAYAGGVPVEIAHRPRNLPGALDPAIKSGNLLNTLLARFEMRDPASYEVIMLNPRGELGEGSLANLFLVDAEGLLHTPALASGILAGITRGLVLRLAREIGLPAREDALPPSALLAASEAFLTASTIEVLPIASVDHRPLPAAAGPVTRALQARYRECVAQELGLRPQSETPPGEGRGR